MERLRRALWLMLGRVPWLRRRAMRTLWLIRARRACRQRSQDVPRLLEKFSIKSQAIDGPKHIVFIVVDCLRKNNISLYGYERETTPFLRSLSDKAAVFENAFSSAPWTYPSVASMLTGLYPHRHGGMHTDRSISDLKCRKPMKTLPNRIHPDILALPELLHPSGFESCLNVAITPAAFATVGRFKNSCVFFGGAESHFDILLRWLKKNRRKRTFMYLHLSDLHEPVNVPVRYQNTFGKIADIPNLNGWEFMKNADPADTSFQEYRENRLKLYDCALYSVDNQIARLFKFLEQDNLLDSCLVFITADHGEEFWEHLEVERGLFYDPNDFAGIAHGHNLFQEVINVPLVCIGSDVTIGRYKHNVSHVDFVPTILDICGIKHRFELDGRNIFDCTAGRVILSEGICFSYEKKAIVKDNWKLIHSESDGVSLLFDLSKDPKEKNNLADAHPDKLQELKTLLPKANVKGEVIDVDRDVQEQLQYLGYM